MATELIEMNGGENASIREMIVIWYLHGIWDKYATLRDTLLS